jgi:hypothetical protein
MPAPTLAFVIIALIVGLYGIDKFLAAQEQAELAKEAHDRYAEGRTLLHAGKAQEAVVDFARAHTLERSSREYVLALATAQLADHQLSAARDTLSDALDEDSNDGRANLLMARVLAAEGRFKDADSFYHRAIYGEWPATAPGEPQKARLELANMLAQHGNSQELLSELLLLQSAPVQDLATEKQVARLFLQSASAQRAADVYRHLVRENPDDIDAYLGLVQAEILAANYRAAENAVMTALRRRPYDERIQSQMRLVARLASLDPTSRRLSTAEKYRRSEEIFELVSAEVNACAPGTPAIKPDKLDGPVTNEKAEARLDQAENLWKQRAEACKQPAAPDDPLPLLMKKLSQ